MSEEAVISEEAEDEPSTAAGDENAAKQGHYLPTYRPTYPPTCFATYLLTYPPTHLTTYTPAHLHTYLPSHLPTFPPACLPNYLPSYLLTYPPTLHWTAAEQTGNNLTRLSNFIKKTRPRLSYMCCIRSAAGCGKTDISGACCYMDSASCC
jgi:hypothetical protein